MYVRQSVSAMVCGDLKTCKNLYPVSPGEEDGTHIVRLSGRCVYPQSHLAYLISLSLLSASFCYNTLTY